MTDLNDADRMKALESAFAEFTRTTAAMGEWYRSLQARVDELDRELEDKNRQLAFANDYLNYILESMSDGVMLLQLVPPSRVRCTRPSSEPAQMVPLV